MIAAFGYFALFSHYRNFAFGSKDLVYKIESTLLDWKQVKRGPRKPQSKVAILAIDEKTLRAFGRWPFSRKYYATAFANLGKLGVKWIGFDVIYSEPEKALLEDAKPYLGALKGGNSWQGGKVDFAKLNQLMASGPADRTFAEAIANFRNIVLGYFYFGTKAEANASLGGVEPFRGLETMAASEIAYDMPEGKTLDDYPLLMKPAGFQSNIPMIAETSEYHGFFSNDPDDDATIRWVNLLANIDGKLMPSLSLKLAAEAMGRDIFVFFDDEGIESVDLIDRETNDSLKVPIDPLGAGRLLLNHLGPGGSFRYFSLADAYHNKFTKEERAALKDSVLLLGSTATGINDMRPNPFDPALDGVENHAAVIDNIMTHNFLKRPLKIYETELLIVLGIGLIFMPILIWSNAAFSAIAAVAFLAGYYYLDKYMWFDRGIWAYMAIPSMQIIGMFITVTLYKYMTEESEKKKVKGAFQHYLSPDVINQVLEDPESLRLGGEKKELTVFFSDVRGFTTISESLSPEKLCELMNEYFTPMTSIILQSKGVLDKYIGDAIMAFWGAPIALQNAPDIAAEASIQMLFALDRLKHEFQAKGFPTIDMGIGLNTGPMSVGNMGSKDRFTYTVMGDSVNLGSRLEGLTKEYGIKVMMSEYTHAKLTPGRYFTRDLDDIRVKGKTKPVRVFDLMRPDSLRGGGDLRGFTQLFNEGRELYRARQFERAKAVFFEGLKIKPEDKSCHMYLGRIENFMQEPPGDDWDGVYTFTHK
jgi:adenylate cyclase